MDTIALLIAIADLAAVNLVLRIGRRLRHIAVLRHRLDRLLVEAAHTPR
jgi:hypothetical protein